MSQTLSQQTSTKTAATTWTIDPTHTAAEYNIRHLFTHFRGVLRGVEGTIVWDAERPEASRIEARIDVRGIDTGLADRDAHLKGPDFFDVERHPHLLYRSREISRAHDGTFRVLGDLTMRGVTRPVELALEVVGEGADAWGGHRGGAIARGLLDRKDFGMVWNTALDHGGIVLGETVQIELHVEAIRRS